MNKAILVVLALFAIVSAEQFRTLNFNQGKLLLRNLATASGKSYAYQDYSGNTGVTVNLGTSYLTSAGIDAATQTDMLLLLYTNATGFCTDCDKLVPFKCTDNSCKADTNSKLQSVGPHFYVQKANPFSIPVTIGSDWKLQDNGALLYTSSASQYSTNEIDYPNGSGGTKPFGYIGNASTYGWVGLGADGNAAKNFQSDHPLFSLSVSGAGSGQLIFGKDSTKFGQYPTPQVFNATANWTMPFINISIGANMDTLTTSKNYVFTIMPDLQSPGLGLPSYSFNNILNKMIETYKLEVDTTLGNFTYVYKGELTGLPNIVFGLTNEQNFTIPPCAYTRKVADGVYNILLYSLTYFWDSDASLNRYTAVLGWPVLSQFYTVFEKQANINATISFYSLNANIPGTSPYPATTTNPTTPTTSTSSWKTIIIIVLVVLVALIVLSFALKKKNNLTKSDLGVELRAARV